MERIKGLSPEDSKLRNRVTAGQQLKDLRGETSLREKAASLEIDVSYLSRIEKELGAKLLLS